MKSHLFHALVLVSALSSSFAFQPPDHKPLANFDLREPAADVQAVTSEQRAAVTELRARVPDARVDFDRVTGSPESVSALDGFLTGSGGQGRAVSHGAASLAAGDVYGPTRAVLAEHAKLFGHGPEALAKARITREFVGAQNGLRTVVWQQHVDDIAVFEGILVSHTTKAGEVVNLSSKFVRDAEGAADRGTPLRRSLVAAPAIGAPEAVARAARNLGDAAQAEDVSVSGEGATTADRHQKLKAPFLRGESEAKLTWLPLDHQNLRLCWDVQLTSRQQREMFRVLVDAQTGEILLRRCLTEYLSDATYDVFLSDSPSPFSPGWPNPNTGQPALVTRTLVTMPALDTNASPAGWINDGGNETLGNNVDAHTDRNDDDSPDLPRPQGSPFRVFNFAMDLTMQDPTNYSQAAVVQLFYLCNWMHDRLYELGFTEAAGNFQSNNFGRGGLGGDALQADAQDGGGYNNANMSTPSDGSAPRMQMYIFSGPGPRRDGDLDAEVVLHEYTHGLSNRRVGGGVGISALQPEGMGEGWSDFYGLTLLSGAGDDVNGCYAAGAYASYLLSGLTQNYYFGIRRYPYCTDMSKNPLTFKDIDPGQASSHSGISRNPVIGTTANEVHNMGEVWCVTLWDARANLIHKYGWAVGNQLILQLVTDGMSLSPANPNFLQARDAILQADLVDNGGANRKELWAAFAKRGMGRSASSPSSSTSSGVVEAYDVPDDLAIAPTVLSASGPVGGPFSPNPASFILTNTGNAPLTWSLINTSSWVNLSPTSGTLAPGGPAAVVSVSISSVATNWSLGGYAAGVWFTNQTSAVAQSCAFTLYVVGRNMFDDFDPGIDLSQWSSFGGVVGTTVVATNYGGSVSGANSLWFGDGGTRFATTVPVNTTSGGTIAFYIRLASGSSWPWEQVDLPGEGVVLEASTNNGASWTTLGTYDTTAYYNWTAMTLSIPAAAQGSAALFRWRQLSHSGSSFDHWALDNVEIDAGPLAPTIQSQPQNQTVFVGDTVTFAVTAFGTQPMTYQWRWNGTNIANATASSLLLTNVQFTNAGSYSVFLSNSIGTVLSSNAVLTVSPPPPCVSPPSGIASWWRAEGNANDTTGTNNGILMNAADFTSGKVGQAFRFNGTSSYVKVPKAPSLDMSNQATIEFWVLVDPTNTLSNDQGLAGSDFYVVEMSTGWQARRGVNFGISTDNGASFAMTSEGGNGGGAAISAGVWHHVAGVYDGTQLQLYIDGQPWGNPIAHSGTISPMPASGFFTIGSEDGRVSCPGCAGARYFKGLMDEVSVYGRALSAAEILAIYSASVSGKCAVPVAPTIASQPQSQSVSVGGTATFTVMATGTPPLSYQWRWNGTNIGSATDSMLVLTNVHFTNAGNYAVLVSNNVGAVISSNAALTVTAGPVCAPAPAGLVAWWRAETNALDSVGANHGTLLNGASFASGEVSSAFTFSGSNQCVEIPYSSSLTLSNYSVEAWIDPLAQVTDPSASVVFEEPWGFPQLVVRKGTTGVWVAFFFARNGSALYEVVSTNQIPLGQFTYVAGTWDGTTLKLYINGSLNNQSLPGTTPITSGCSFYIGGMYHPAQDSCQVIGQFFTGLIDEVSVYNRALSGAEVQAIYSAGTAGKCGTPIAPTILNQPQGQSVSVGSTATFTVTAAGTLPLSYHWRWNGTNLSGATASSLVLSSVQFTNAGNYAVLVSNIVGTALSSNAILVVNSGQPCALPPSGLVSWWPADASGADVVSANNGVLTNGASFALGKAGLSFSFNGSNSYVRVPKAPSLDMSNQVTIEFWVLVDPTNTLSNDQGLAGTDFYLIEMSTGWQARRGVNFGISTDNGASFAMTSEGGNGGGATISAGVWHHVAGAYDGTQLQLYIDGQAWGNPIPHSGTISPMPASGFFAIGSEDGRVSCPGCAGARYFKGLMDEVSVYSRALTAAEIQGIYAAGSAGKCAITTPPVIVLQPANQTAFLHSNATFNVQATGAQPLQFQWRFNGTNLVSQTNTTLTLVGVTTNQAGPYSVVVTNFYGSSTSSNATLAVYVPTSPVITRPPESLTVPAGTNASFSVTAGGDPPYGYQWLFGNTNLPGATNAILSLADVQAANMGVYAVIVTSPYGGATSAPVTLTVVPATPLVTSQPLSRAVFPGSPASFSVAVTGTEPFTYQWQLNGTNINGATNATLSLPAARRSDAGLYHVAVSNSIGGVISADALLALVPVAAWGYDGSGQTDLWLALTNAVQIAAGANHSLALCRDGSVVAWGAPDQTNVPPAISNAVAIAAGGGHSLALTSDGRVLAWGGTNGAGQTTVPASLTNATAIAAGGSHSLALTTNGTVVAWGASSYGQTAVPSWLTNVVAISAGSNHSLALQANGNLVAWGDNTYGQITIPTNLNDVVSVSAGALHSAALKRNGTIVVWGANTYGQVNCPANLSNVTAIACGAFHTLALQKDGTLVAWGAGTNIFTYPNVGQSVIPNAVTNVTSISGGGAHTLAFAGDGAPFITVPPVNETSFSGRRVVFRAAATGALPLSYQWQLNSTNIAGATNQLLVIENAYANWAGDYRIVVSNALGQAASRSRAATLTLLDSAPTVLTQPVGQVAYLGGQSQLQVTVDGSGPFYFQWRLNGTNVAGATSATLLLNRVLLNQGGTYSVVVSNAFGAVSSGKATISILQTLAWGAGGFNYGQTNVPAGLSGIVAAAGGTYHTLAVKGDGRVLSWGAGSNYTSALNYGQSLPPGTLSNALSVAGGLYHSLALKSDGSVVAWGAGTSNAASPHYGQSIIPANLTNAVAVAAGDYHSVVLKSDGKIVVWGNNTYLQTNVPASVTNVVAVASRGGHILALKADGSLVHWGSLSSLPSGVSNLVTIAAGVNHCLSLKNDGTVISWGSLTSVPAGLSNVVDIAAGSDFSLALKNDGTVAIWGTTNAYGLSLMPSGLTSAIGIGAGSYHGLVVLGDGTPLVRWQPAGASVYLGGQASFRVIALGGQPLSYQWQANGSNIAAATNTWLALTNVQTTDAGSYRVVITNAFGSVTSSVASLTVLVPLAQALDTPGLSWTASGNAAWFGQTNVTHDGVDAGQSGLISDGQQSAIQTVVSGAGVLSFWWKVSSEEFFDYLSFYVDGVRQAGISGEVDWQYQTFPIANGTHTLSWTYAKDASVSVGADTGWLDQVTFATNRPVITTQPLSQTVPMGGAATLLVTASGAPPLTYQWVKDGTNVANATASSLTVSPGTRRSSGAYAVLVSNPGGTTSSSNAVLVVPVPQKLTASSKLSNGTFRLTSADADGGALGPGDLPDFEAQVSTNLVNWVTLSNSLTLTNGTLLLVDPAATNSQSRFYRMVEH